METRVLERIRMCFVPAQLWQSLRQSWDSLCLTKQNISVWQGLMMVHVLQSVSSAPSVTVSPKSRDLGAFLFCGKQFGSSSSHWRSYRREQTCECHLSVPVLRCWSSLCWLKKSSVPPWPPELGKELVPAGAAEVKCPECPWGGSSPSLAQTSDVVSCRAEYLTHRSPGYTGLTPPIPCQRYCFQKCLLWVTSVVFPLLWLVMEIMFSQHKPLCHAECFQESFYLPGKGDLGTKIRLLCSQRAPVEVSQCGQSLCLIPVGRSGCLESFYCPSTG